MLYDFKLFISLALAQNYAQTQAGSGWRLHSLGESKAGWLLIMEK
jgi:hypothetical protein